MARAQEMQTDNTRGMWGTIPYSECIKYLGVLIDCNIHLHHHIASQCKTVTGNLFKIVNIFLTTEACQTAMLATIISHLDYANAIMVGLPEKHISKLQHVQNIAEIVVLKRESTLDLQTVFRPYTACPLGVG